MSRRMVQRALAVSLLALACASQAAYPDKPIKLIVPFSAGTSVDVLAREFAKELGRIVNQPVIIDNRVGAEGAIGAKAVTSAAPDGYTALITSNSTVVLESTLKTSLPYDPVKDLAPVCTMGRVGSVMSVRSSLPYKSVAEFIAAAKAEPGKFTFAYSTSNTRLAAELFQQRTGVKMLGVPYKSTVTGLTDLAGEKVDMFFIDPVSVAPFLQSGKITAFAVGGAQRIKELPQVPTLHEAGVTGYETVPFIALYLPSKTPADTATQLRDAARQAIHSPSMKAFKEKAGYQDFSLCGDDFVKWQSEQITFWRQVIKNANIASE
jgi:tripartite-type tricarboxylate transporter receptor subunit TctC